MLGLKECATITCKQYFSLLTDFKAFLLAVRLDLSAEVSLRHLCSLVLCSFSFPPLSLSYQLALLLPRKPLLQFSYVIHTVSLFPQNLILPHDPVSIFLYTYNNFKCAFCIRGKMQCLFCTMNPTYTYMCVCIMHNFNLQMNKIPLCVYTFSFLC